MKLFCLYYEYYEIDKPELDVEKVIGFYSSYNNSLEALIKSKNNVEFSHHPEGLIIDTLILDDDKYWMDGFGDDDE